MAQNYKLLKYISTSINLMESFGLVPHRSFVNDNNSTLENSTEIDNNNFILYIETVLLKLF
jgi:hypothetical protein